VARPAHPGPIGPGQRPACERVMPMIEQDRPTRTGGTVSTGGAPARDAGRVRRHSLAWLRRAGGAAGRVVADLAPAVSPRLAAGLCARAGLQDTVDGGPAFDAAFYCFQACARYGPVRDPLLHYLLVGSRAGLRPMPHFDPDYYRRANPDVVMAGYEPFAHYLRFGRAEGRAGVQAGEAPMGLSPPPALETMRAHARARRGVPRVDLVMPVYGNRALSLQAIDSVLRSAPEPAYELIVVDDASPDPLLRQELAQLAAWGLITLATNHQNLGFVSSVNRGMALHPDRDVVLLNSDTQVFGDWLGRLLGVLHSGERVATATPLSNAATILSYPVSLRDNSAPMGMPYADIDALCASLDAAPVELPTGIGFCMAIRRAALDEVGVFDAVRFGRGYGEENDFCRRAAALGWRHLCAANVFVWHRGGASFGPEKQALSAAAQTIVEALHPGYRATVQRFIRRDPLRPVRESLDAARIAVAPMPKLLHLGHSAARDRGDALRLHLVHDLRPFAGHYRLVASGGHAVPNLPRVGISASVEMLAALMARLGIGEVQAGGAAELQPAMVGKITAAAAIAGVRVCHV
jgi:GT2 family glycosyltransferase